MYCDSTIDIYLTSGSKKTCYTSCVEAFESCEDAGYYSDDENLICSSSPSITLTNGEKIDCYGDCVVDCNIDEYSDLERLIGNTDCPTVTMTADVDGTSDTSEKIFTFAEGQTLDGQGYTLDLYSQRFYLTNNTTISNINIFVYYPVFHTLDTYFSVETITLSNIGLQIENNSGGNYAVCSDANDLIMTGDNSIKVYYSDTNSVAHIIGAEYGSSNFTLTEGSTLTLYAEGGKLITGLHVAIM